jgi:hypothetical protein
VVYDDYGMADYSDTSAHICLNDHCDFVLIEQAYASNMGGGRGYEPENVCLIPGCHRSVKMTN